MPIHPGGSSRGSLRGRRNQLDFWPEEQTGERLRWSFSRDKRLRDCERKYYLYHYGSRGGAHAPTGSSIREIYVLKQLKNRHMWVGEVVHDLTERFLRMVRDGHEIRLSALVDRGIRRMRANYADSQRRVYRERPEQVCGLVEHEYDEPIERSEWMALRDRMERCVRNFFDLRLLHAICATPPHRWLALESLSSFVFEGATVLVKPDFAWRDEAGRVVIADWKTGKPREAAERLQLGVYAIHACRTRDVTCDQVLCHAVYLDTGDITTLRLGEADLREAAGHIRESVAAMRRLAIVVEQNEDPIERFAMTDDSSVCSRCNFRRLCGRA